ncbi:Dyp-type peroxidase [Tricholoma matsutake]|nr:Dyp-type peroxidase [Tricholoma matsutake 945]
MSLDLENIQGDILSGLPKKTQTYFFFQITEVESFRRRLWLFANFITTVKQVQDDRKAINEHKSKGNTTFLPIVGVNIAFSHKGFVKMGIDDSVLTGDANFLGGQKQDAESLGDKGTGSGANFVPDWDAPFLEDIHGVILVSGGTHEAVNETLEDAQFVLGLTPVGLTFPTQSFIKEVTTIVGDVRPGKESGHEHFGFLDNISNPSVIGFDNNPNPGPKQVPAGVLVMGHTGDTVTDRKWAVDGSFLAFRYLLQGVPEFDKYLKDTAPKVPVPGFRTDEVKELLGARFIGRWKNGTPIDLSPFTDSPSIAADPQKINNFHYSGELNFQKVCPFASHTRKTNPRADLEDAPAPHATSIEHNRIMRRGVQFGPEVTQAERDSGETVNRRGLLFACYQTSITTGFAFLQKSTSPHSPTCWANNAKFQPFQTTPQVPGLDPIIGQGNREMSGIDPDNPATVLSNIPVFVTPRGGEYFFSPSLKALEETIGNAA